MARPKNGNTPKYTVYNNYTDVPVIVYATAKECANSMGIDLNTFHHYLGGSKQCGKWHIMRED